ncbi:hypothetical protein [Botrimarina sp.]|uniref:hypothetical protein n=1 Tax=Botrimarina sp. TaxID=2795802 RepID=UPI0032EF2748
MNPPPATLALGVGCLLWSAAPLLGAAGGPDRGAPPVAQAPAAPDSPDDGDAELVGVFRCRFGHDRWDVNYDDWPDQWTRLYDAQHPQYVRMGIEPVSDEHGRALVIRPDGAAAQASSPPIPIIPKFSYKLRLRVRVAGVEHGAARVQMAFCDGADRVQQLEQVSDLPSDSQWRDIELGDFEPSQQSVDRLYLRAVYERGERGDLNAEIAIADLRLYRLPSIRIATNSPYNVYTEPSQVRVTCRLSGILEQNPEIRFQLLDATDKAIGGEGEIELEGEVIHESRTRASEIVDGFGSDKPSYEGSVEWRPPIDDYGFYRVRVGMFSAETGQPIGEARSITVAVVRKDLQTSQSGEFGWSLPDADDPLPFDVLQDLLPRVGVRKVKLPVWFPAGDERRADTLLRFAEQLTARGIDTIGVLEDPSHHLKSHAPDEAAPPIEGLLSADPSYWIPLIDPVITRLSLRIRWWQLGADGDTSFVGYGSLPQRIGDIRNRLFRFGQDVRLAIGWRWDHTQDWRERLTWDGEQMAGREQLDAAGLAAAFASAPRSTVQRWVLVAPPEVAIDTPPGADLTDPEGPLVRAAMVRRHQQRVRDFVEQVLVAKVNNADGIFIADPFSGSADARVGRTGVMNDDGTPGELLLPWRTCARLLGGAEHLGSLQLPGGSNNWLFRRPDGQVVMVLWNLGVEVTEDDSASIEEVLYLGEDPQVIDVWGKSTPAELRDGRHVVPVGRMPRFVFGLNDAVARWRMATRFERTNLPSVFGTPHENRLSFTNTFGQGVGGRVGVFVPELDGAQPPLSDRPSKHWRVQLRDDRIRLAAGEEAGSDTAITLLGAGYGPQPVRIDFMVQADREYRFSVWRQLHVGENDVELEIDSYLDESGRLIVEQQMRNREGRPSDFKCLLYAPQRRPKRAQVFQLGPETDKKEYRYLNAESLIGEEFQLQIEELDGQRVFLHRFRAKRQRRPPANPEKSGGTESEEPGPGQPLADDARPDDRAPWGGVPAPGG